jgi:BMFP domain-containing protein YqiC
MTNDIFATLRTYLNKVSDGDKSASEVASTVNQWLREGGEALKIKIEDEVERSVSKMGFVKRGEFEALKEEVARLRVGSNSAKSTPIKKSAKKASTRKSAAKKPSLKKTSSKKASSQ